MRNVSVCVPEGWGGSCGRMCGVVLLFGWEGREGCFGWEGREGCVEREPPASSTGHSGVGGVGRVSVGGGVGVVGTMLCGL